MARRKLTEASQNVVSLADIIPVYGQHKEAFDAQKKQCDEENKQIKKLMEEADVTDYSVGGYTAKYSTQERCTMNEDKLLEVIKRNKLTDLIRTKEYVDSDLLEKAIYNGQLSKEVQLEIASCNEIKLVPVLKVTKDKGGK